MADWFVDASTTTGNGTDPASPFSSVLSITWADGDKAWVRNTHTEALTSSQFIGPNSTWIKAFSKWGYLIGWPQAGMPFYAERPARGVTVGWDADVPTTDTYSTFKYKFPSFSNSNANSNIGVLLPRGGSLMNLYLVNCGGGASHSAWAPSSDPRLCIMDNVMPVPSTVYWNSWNASRLNAATMKHLIVANSNTTYGTVRGTISSDLVVDQIEIHSLSQTGASWADTNIRVKIRHLVNWSNSIANLFGGFNGVNTPDMSGLSAISVGRFSGTAPYSGVIPGSLSSNQGPKITFDDYLGTGPVVYNDPGQGDWALTTAAAATYNSVQAIKLSVKSCNVAHQAYSGKFHQAPIVRKLFNVVSGTPLTINIPFYVDSTAVFSCPGGNLYGSLLCLGGAPLPVTSTKLIAGSYTPWAGTLIAGGSAWLGQLTWTPIETNSAVAFELYGNPITQVSSGLGLNAYMVIGQPY